MGANWDFGYGSGLPQDSHNVEREYANSDFDIRHRLTVSLTYAIPGRKGFGQMAEGWELNTITTLESPQYWGPMDEGTDAAGVGPLAHEPTRELADSMEFLRLTDTRTSNRLAEALGIPEFPRRDERGLRRAGTGRGWRISGSCNGLFESVRLLRQRQFRHVAAAARAIWKHEPEHVSGRRLQKLRFLGSQEFSLCGNHAAAVPRRVLQHFQSPNFANPYGGQNGFGLNDPSAGGFGCGCATPDVAAANPAIGSGGSRAVQLASEVHFLMPSQGL